MCLRRPCRGPLPRDERSLTRDLGR
eukprot:gene11908-biopygen1869